ncbi:transposase DDE domain protein, partial [Leptospira borgpetersenii str. Brem 328]
LQRYRSINTKEETFDLILRKKGEKPLIGKYKGKSRRWVVERTNSWHNRFRAILIRWERKPENYLASLYLASSIIAFNFFDR